MTAVRPIALLALVAAAILGYQVSLPPARRSLVPGTSLAVRGAIHVHTRRSDGAGTIDQVAAAAARAGLAFIVLTDHGDGTRDPDPPAYVHGVLVIDGMEVSTEHGHVIVVGHRRSPFPLGGEARDVVEDVARLGGVAIAAHPDSPKPGLRWTAWTAPVDGLEWLNADSEWRDERPVVLARTLLAYPFRGAEAVGLVLDRPEATLDRWDEMTARRRVIALGAVDAHGGPSHGSNPYTSVLLPRLPRYEDVFRALSVGLTGIELTGDPAADAGAVIEAIRAGHVYSSVDALAVASAFAFTGVSGSAAAQQGDFLAPDGPVELSVRTNAPVDARIRLFRNGQEVAAARGSTLRHLAAGARAVYRVEVALPQAPGEPPVPWIVSNPIYVREPDPEQVSFDANAPPAVTAVQDGEHGGDDLSAWRIESSARARGAIAAAGADGRTELSLRFALGGTMSESPYVALVMPAGRALPSYDRLVFRARARQPMRLSVQLRAPEGEDGERWRRSVYLDERPREVTVFFDDMTPVGPTSRQHPSLEKVDSVLFVIDTVNTRIGTSGEVWIGDVRYGRRADREQAVTQPAAR